MYVQVVPAFVVLSFFGWILFVAGFGKEFKGYIHVCNNVYTIQMCIIIIFIDI